MLTIVERVILLQEVDAFEKVPTDCLARIAAVAAEVELSKGEDIFEEGAPADSMYIVIEGSVSVLKGSEEVLSAGSGEALGVWSLFDEERRVVSARTAGRCLLLQIKRANFLDVLAEDVHVTRSLLLSLVRRLRGLIEQTGEAAS